jgi:hypothetical protein
MKQMLGDDLFLSCKMIYYNLKYCCSVSCLQLASTDNILFQIHMLKQAAVTPARGATQT